MNSEERISNILDRASQNLKEADAFPSFLLCAKDYVEFVLETKEFNSAITQLIKKKNDSLAKLEETEELAIEELDNAEKYIRTFLKDEPVQKGINGMPTGLYGLDEYKKGNMQMSGIRSHNISNFLDEAICSMPQQVKEKIIERYKHDSQNTKDITQYFFSKSLRELYDLIDKYSIERKKEIWGYWDLLSLIPKALPTLYTNDMGASFGEKFSYLDTDIVGEYVRLVMAIKDDRTPTKRIDIIKNYRDLVPRINLYLQKEILLKNTKTFEKGITTKAYNEKFMVPASSQFDMYSGITESIILSTLGVEIVGDRISRGKEKVDLNPADRALVYFLFYKYRNNPDECFKIGKIAEELKKSEGYIKNRIVYINGGVKKMVPNEKTSVPDFIKNGRSRRGYHLNPRLMIYYHKNEE